MRETSVDPRINFPTFTPASGAQYLPRYEIEQDIWESLRSGMDVIVSGPRRSGKTSLLQSIRGRATEEPALWSESGPDRKKIVCYVDAQHPQPERQLCDQLATVLPEALKPTAALLARSGDANEELLQHYLHEVLRALRRARIDVLLLIDEVDLPLQRSKQSLWRDFLNLLFRNEDICLVVTTDAQNVDGLGIRGSDQKRARIRQVELRPWNEQEIRNLIKRAVSDESLVTALSKVLAPAWPLEVMLVIHHLIEEGVPNPSQVASLLEDPELTEYGRALLSRAFSRLDRSETKIAMGLLTSIATRQDADRGTIDAKPEGQGENLAKWLPIARVLAQAGILAMNGRMIAAATPVMLRAVLSLLGR
jgi:hypothetical protein